MPSGGVSPKREVHRDLRADTTPGSKGEDVKALQESVNARLTTKRLPWALVDVDGEMGPQTLAGCDLAAFAYGLSKSDRKQVREGVVTQPVQRKLRDPRQRTQAERDKAKSRRRHDRLKELRRAHRQGPEGAVRMARGFVGVTEKPRNSNRGPEVDKFELEFGRDLLGAPWCGCFVGYVLNHGGGCKIGRPVVLDSALINAGRNGTHGFLRLVPVGQERPGDVVVYKFRHIGLIVGPTKNGLLWTVEGNTSNDPDAPTSQQNNGGMVAERKHDRSVSQVWAIVRPRYST